MASSAASIIAVKESLVIAVFVVLLFHSSVGHQPPKPPRHCHSTGPSPSPSPLPPASTPTPVPAPPPTLPPPPPASPTTTPTPAPAPAPVNNCSASDCAAVCTPICQAKHDAGVAQCKSNFDANLNVCHDQCTSYACPGGSCIPSGGCNCPCDNANATSCCQGCGGGAYTQYMSCERTYDKGFGYCMTDCGNTCYNNCTQLGA